MTTQTSDNFSAFASLHRFFSLSETTKPTPEQAQAAAAQLIRMYGAESEEELLERGDPSLIQIYNETKNKILNAAM